MWQTFPAEVDNETFDQALRKAWKVNEDEVWSRSLRGSAPVVTSLSRFAMNLDA